MVLERVLSLDIGTKRIGVALSDPLQIFATGLKVVLRTSDEEALKEIKEIAEKNAIKTIIAGVPYNMDGSIGQQALNCITFAKKLSPLYNIVYEDERTTSSEAEEILRTLKKKYTRDKGLVDIKSAEIILQHYLDRK